MKFARVAIAAAATLAAVAKAEMVVPLDMIHEINMKQSLWYAEANHMTRLSEAEVKQYLGVDIETLKKYDWSTGTYKYAHELPPMPSTAENAFPEEFDARDKWTKCPSIGAIRDQRQCGSCWAFGAVEAMGDRTCIALGKDIPLSAEDMNSCASSCGSCNGGQPGCAWRYWVSSGIVSEACYPYTAGTNYPTPPCQKKCTGDTSLKWDAEKHFGATTTTPTGVNDMMKSMSEEGPVEVAFTVYSDFMSYAGGVYKHTSGTVQGGHAVKMLGWGVDEVTKTPYWLCANSWNTSWGEKGFFRIIRGQNECGIERSVWAGKAKGGK